MGTKDFGMLVRVHGPTLAKRARILTRSESDASDLFQDTIEHALRAKRYDGDVHSALPWLLTIMRNLFIDARRAHVSRWVPLDRTDFVSSWVDRSQEPPSRWRCIDDDVLMRAIGELPSSAAAMLRRSLEGACYADLATRFEIPIGTVGARLHRVRRRLRERLLIALDEAAAPGADRS